jgi:glycosyltransferase involved in cell wall biosynthesis
MTGAQTGPAVPVLVGDLHLDAPLPDLNGEGRYRGARLLAWLHGRPLGEVVLPLGPYPLPGSELAARTWALTGEQIVAHCTADGLPPPAQLPPGGLASPPQPACRTGRLPTDLPKVTVVIATRERTGSLLRCLDSLAQVDYPAFDVLVVDSAPSTGTTARALSGQPAAGFPVSYLRVPQPGLALAHNAALPAVTGEIVAFTDDDVEVHPDWLGALAAAFTAHDATCVTGLILPAELETRPQLLVEQAGGYSRGFTSRTYQAGMTPPTPLFPFTAGRFGSGANMAFRTDWLAAQGGFDPATGAGSPARGGDDLTAFLKVITSGGTLVYEPAAVVRHWHRRDYAGMRRQSFGYGVGLGAYLTASVWARPGLLWAMLRRAGPAARHLLAADSAKNAGRGESFPRELVWRERAGVLVGPFAYTASRWRYRHRSAQGAGEAG